VKSYTERRVIFTSHARIIYNYRCKLGCEERRKTEGGTGLTESETCVGRGNGGGCPNCERLPERPGSSGMLYLWSPLGHTLGKVRRHLSQSGLRPESAAGGGLSVSVGDGARDLLSSLSEDTLTGTELGETRALFKSGGGELEVSDIPRVAPLGRLAGLGRSEWLLDLLAEERLTVHFQPIVSAGAPDEVYARECLLRGLGEDGSTIPPGQIFDAARDCGALFQTDLAARRAAIREAAAHGLTANLFVNFTPTSVYDPVFCLSTTVEAVDEAGIPHENVTFEVTESEDVGDTGHLENIVRYYREQGFRIALDDLGSGYSSLNLIHRLRPDFVKLDIGLIRDVDTDPYKAVIARKLLELAQSLGIQTIAEGIETPGELSWVRKEGADFVQGFLIAKPAAPQTHEP
jgi:EAL domain-containing protein (putative c-di-GMP-specific phosphodiesterase class I)